MSNSLTKSHSAPAPVLQPQTFDQLVRFAEMAASSELVPRDYKGKPANIMIAVQMGSELGLAPMQAIQNIAVVNGRPSVWGDALLGLVKSSPVCDDVVERLEGDGDAMVAVCTATRKGKKAVEARFSVEDAKKAGLWGKQGPWQQYPKRMMQMRARGFALRDAFPDVLRGLISAEEAQDIPADASRGPTIDVTPQRDPAQKRQQVESQPVDHIQIMRDRIDQCADMRCCDLLWKKWEETISKAQAAGKPIASGTAQQVFDMIAEKSGSFGTVEHEEEVPA